MHARMHGQTNGQAQTNIPPQLGAFLTDLFAVSWNQIETLETVDDATIFPENFKSLDTLSKMLEINIKCSEILAWGQNFWNQSKILQGSKVKDFRLSPLPKQISHSKLFFGIIFLFVSRFLKFLLLILQQIKD